MAHCSPHSYWDCTHVQFYLNSRTEFSGKLPRIAGCAVMCIITNKMCAREQSALLAVFNVNVCEMQILCSVSWLMAMHVQTRTVLYIMLQGSEVASLLC